jgi:hypothetical protein
VHKPTLQTSSSKDDDINAAENKQFEIELKAEFDGFMKRKQRLETNMSKAYAFLWEQCSKAIQSKIKARFNYDKKDSSGDMIKNHQINLLVAIKHHALSFQELRYEMSILLDSFRAVLNLK